MVNTAKKILENIDVNGSVKADEFIGTSTKAKGLVYLEPTVTTTGVLWSVTSSDITEYYDGLMVSVLCPENTASNLQLKINNLDPVTIVYNVTSGISSRYSQNSIILMTFKTITVSEVETSYWSIMDYDANTDTKVRQYQVTGNTNYPILTRYNTTDKQGTYEATYTRFDTKTTLNHSTGVIQSTLKYVTTSNNFPLLFCGTSGVSATTNRESTTPSLANTIYCNPSTGNIQANKFNSYVLGQACEKQIGSIASGNTGLVTGGDVYTGLSNKQQNMTFTDISLTESD